MMGAQDSGMGTPMQTVQERWRADDGVELPVTLVTPPQPTAAVVIGSAMGVPRQFYRRFAGFLASRGMSVATFDYRGIAEAAEAVADPAAIRLEQWALDLRATLREMERRFPGIPRFLVGHSMGCQLPGLVPEAERLAGFVFVVPSAPNVRQWTGLGRVMLWLWVNAVIPLFARGPWFPARRLRFSTVDIPAGAMRQWAGWVRSPGYLFSPQHGFDTSRYARLSLPALAYSFTDDAMTTRAAAEALLDEYPRLQAMHRHIGPPEAGVREIGHLGYFREGCRDTLWRETAGWIERVAGQAAPARAASA